MLLGKMIAACSSLLFLIGGCDLLSDATKFTVDTDWQVFSVDSAALGLSVPSGSALPAIPCSTANDLCAQATSPMKCGGQSYACRVQCGSKATCEVVASTEQSTSIDLSQQIKNNTQASALNKVALQRMVFNTEENTLNFDTPSMEFYVGPNAATKTTDAGVVFFGTMPSIPHGTKLNGEITVTAAGKSALADRVKNYQTPFRLLAKAALSFASGSPLPQGRAVVKLKAYFEIEPLK